MQESKVIVSRSSDTKTEDGADCGSKATKKNPPHNPVPIGYTSDRSAHGSGEYYYNSVVYPE